MKSYLKPALWILAIAVAAGALYYGLSGNGSVNGNATSGEAQPVTILKYSDYQCPACKAYIPLQEQLKQEFGDRLTIEYRHFPLNGHQYAELAARAAEAARMQGMYKEMHDKIFEGQELWSRGGAEEHFTRYAEELGLDTDQFLEDLDSEEVRTIVRNQRSEGDRRLVNATPTFFINGQRVQQTPQSYAQFRSLVEMHMYR